MKKKIKILLFCLLLSLPTTHIQAELLTLLAGTSTLFSQYGLSLFQLAAANPYVTAGIASAVAASGGAIYKAYYSGIRGELRVIQEGMGVINGNIAVLSDNIQAQISKLITDMQTYIEKTLLSLRKDVAVVDTNVTNLSNKVMPELTKIGAIAETTFEKVEAQGKQLAQTSSVILEAHFSENFQHSNDNQVYLIEKVNELNDKFNTILSQRQLLDSQTVESKTVLLQQTRSSTWSHSEQKDKETKYERQQVNLEEKVTHLSVKIEQFEQVLQQRTNMQSAKSDGIGVEALAMLRQQNQQILEQNQHILNKIERLVVEKEKQEELLRQKEEEYQAKSNQLIGLGMMCGMGMHQSQASGGVPMLPMSPSWQPEQTISVNDFRKKTAVVAVGWGGE